jgi:hypothetical protein
MARIMPYSLCLAVTLIDMLLIILNTAISAVESFLEKEAQP